MVSGESPCRLRRQRPTRPGEAGGHRWCPCARTPSSKWEGPGLGDLWGPGSSSHPPPREGTQPSKLPVTQACVASGVQTQHVTWLTFLTVAFKLPTRCF